MKYVLKINGMSCNHCVKHVNSALSGTDGIKSCYVVLENKSAEIETDREFSNEELAAIIDEAGYELEEVKADF